MKPNLDCQPNFLGWDAPLLPAAARLLCERFAAPDRIDLRPLLCVLPSARSLSDLKQQLRIEADRRGVEIKFPEVATIGQFAEQLYQPPQQIALEIEQTLAWATVLQSLPAGDLKPLIPVVPEPEPIGPWVDFGGTLRRLHEVLSANLIGFADVAIVAETEGEQRRWKLLANIFTDYLSELAKAKICDPHIARRQAVAENRCHTDKTIVLIGTSDLSDAMIEMLGAVDTQIISLVAAPQQESNRFDPFGCVLTDRWLDHHLPVVDDQFISAGGISDQSQAVAESIQELRSQFSSGEITVGVTDPTHVAPVEFELRGRGIASYRHVGWTLSETAVGRLMNLLSTYLRRQTWQSLAALVRHGDVCAWVSGQLEIESSQWLTDLDRLLADYFPVRVSDDLSGSAGRAFPVARKVVRVIEEWLSDFDSPQQSISAWSAALARCIDRLYEHRLDRPNVERTIMAVEQALLVLGRFSELNAHLDVSVGSAAAMEMLTGRLGDIRFGETLDPHDVQIAGWLDLSLDTSPAMVVIGMNHPFVPSAVTNDPFLPGSLRTKLGIADNDRRFARDIYAMHLMVSTRPETRFIVGRMSADGSPTPPSRLMAAAAPEDSARRVLKLLDTPRQSVALGHRWDQGPAESNLPIPPLDGREPLRTVDAMSVTAFQLYLTCPYRFYLRHVLNLRPLSDDGTELEANQFGDLIHNTLDLFGNDLVNRDESNPAKIRSVLLDYLHQYATDRYGKSPNTSIALQIAQAERRLKVVAHRQAERIADGWRIQYAEKSAGAEQGSGIEVDGGWMTLKGRFDRIDFHPASNRWAILDYKTHGDLPAKKHFKRTSGQIEWLELQLPLYRMMAPFLDIDADPMDVELGYFNISQKDSETGIHLADFGEALMHNAREKILQCIRDIWAGKFAPTDQTVQYDDYEMILQTNVAH